MRARNIKPGFFKNDGLSELPFEVRLLFTGLWCLADREGRLEDRPSKIRAEIFPYEMQLNVDSMLAQLQDKGFVIRYELKTLKYLQITNFTRHQQPHYKEAPSLIPAPKGHKDSLYIGGGVPEALRAEVLRLAGHKCSACTSRRDMTIDHIIPRVIGGTNDISNLQVLCRKCNSAKNNKINKQANVDPTLTQHRVNQSGALASDSLIPDSPSLIPDSREHPSATDFAGVFESLWLEYPKRLGKKGAYRHFISSVRNEADVQNIRKALAAYKQHVRGKDRQYIKHGDSWFNNWSDWTNFTEENENASHGGKSLFSPTAVFRAKKEAEKLRANAPGGAVLAGDGDLPDVPLNADGNS